MSTEISLNGGSTGKLLPRLRDDGTNWVLYKERLHDILVGQGYRKHLMGREKAPVKTAITADMSDAKREEALDKYEELMDEYAKKESAIRSIILSTIPEKIQQRIVSVRPASATWEKLCSIFDKPTISNLDAIGIT